MTSGNLALRPFIDPLWSNIWFVILVTWKILCNELMVYGKLKNFATWATQLGFFNDALPDRPYSVSGSYSTNFFSKLPGFLEVQFGSTAPWEVWNLLFQNALQSLYHAARRDLGLVFENQIYVSPETYNLSILNMLPDEDPLNVTMANATEMSEWKATILAFEESDRVPVMTYF
ncbi:hypothetical protein C8J57DRAFT_1248475 [Mycena rebaudengoi]|nr:hypothetical protein C8J57DRAFT_1248475 [Mycena rebaudengoi]